MSDFWNQRYSTEEYVYGTEPNEFFKERLDLLQPGTLLLPGEGEGRNALYALQKGWKPEAFDWSTVAREKALKLAAKNGFDYIYNINTFEDFVAKPGCYDAAALIYIHLPPDERLLLHQKIIASLKPGGVLFLEAYDKDQLGKKSGGPQEPELLYSMAELVEDFIDLDFELLTHLTINLKEGKFHQGEASVVRFCGVKH